MVTASEVTYPIRVAAALCGLHEQSLRLYERRGLVLPRRSAGNVRRYSAADIERIRFIKRLIDDLGVNLAGVEVILHMREQLLAAQSALALQKGDYPANLPDDARSLR